MLTSLVALSALLRVQNPQFPKPDLDTPAALRDRSIFKYLSDEDRNKDWKPLVAGRDWSNLVVPPTKPDALRLRVLLTVAERDFSDPHYSNIMETRDKTRLLAAVSRLKSIYSVISNGAVSIDIIPRFYPLPIYDIRQFKELIETEYNKTKFEADDNYERGPFAAILAISSSHVSMPDDPNALFSIQGFSDLGGSGQDMWLEEGLFYLTQGSIQRRLKQHFAPFGGPYATIDSATNLVDPLGTLKGDAAKLFDPNFRQDGDIIAKWGETATPNRLSPDGPNHTALQSPGTLEAKDGVLSYSEVSLMRAGAFALPASSGWSKAKSLKFEFRTTSVNPIALKIWTSDSEAAAREVVLGNQPGMVPIQPNNEWQSISIDMSPEEGKVQGVTIGAPTAFYGTGRLRAELNQYQFRNFELSSEAGTATAQPGNAFGTAEFGSEDQARALLTSGNRFQRRSVLRQIDKLKDYKGLAPLLLSLAGDLDAGTAYDATCAYFEVMLNGQPTPEDLAGLGKFLTAPPNEAAREAALGFVPRNPSFTTFGAVAACTVRESWQIRRAALVGLNALAKAGVKEAPACKELIRVSTSQDMGIMRKTAVGLLDPTVQADSDRLIYLMVNDPCESVRLECLRIVAASANAPKDKVLGTLADDSPTFREQIPAMLGPSHPWLREALQRMVVDQDPYVKVAALRSFAALGNVQDGEIQNLFADKHPAVQLALIEGAKKGAWKIPADTLDHLKASPVKAVAMAAAGVK